MESEHDRTRYWLVAIVVLAAALRVVPIWFGLPYPHTRPDEETAVGLAVRIQAGDLNPHFFKWPSLTLYVFAGLYARRRGSAACCPSIPRSRPSISRCSSPGASLP